MARSVLQDWVMELPLREQGTLLTVIRGCDLAPKPQDPNTETAERQLTAFLRWCILIPADPREVDTPGAFMRSRLPEHWKPSQFGHYPLHWVLHMMHAAEVIGYRHPDTYVRTRVLKIYNRFVASLHLVAESRASMIDRLSEDRIAGGNIVS